MCFLFFKQKTSYELRIRYWSSDVCSSDLTTDKRSARGTSSVVRLGRECLPEARHDSMSCRAKQTQAGASSRDEVAPRTATLNSREITHVHPSRRRRRRAQRHHQRRAADRHHAGSADHLPDHHPGDRKSTRLNSST